MTQHNPDLPKPPPPGHQVGSTSPAQAQPRWSGKKTAVVAALAIGLSSAGAITASAAVASGTGGGDGRMRGGFRNMRTFEGGFGSQQGSGNAGTGGTAGNSQRNRSSRNAPDGSAPGNGMPSAAPTGGPGATGRPGSGSDT